MLLIYLTYTVIDEETRKAREKDHACRAYADYQEMIEKERLDAVTVATPDHLHTE